LKKYHKPNYIYQWLQHQSSLTQKAKDLGYDVKITLLNEQWHSGLFRREVIIRCNDDACWYGRTSIPIDTYQLRINSFKNLSINPIGSILFNDPNITIKKRRFFQYKTERLNFLNLSGISVSEKNLRGRVTVFDIEQQPLYLTEIFLPIMRDVKY
jgi:chorismate--pyruvate lyase